ncbi:MAG: chemotaxis protein CheX [Anaerolineae bacterium]|nr:chemotaxis protein CheX [Anaerolineae bacterium]MDW8099702.1 chemotaxis protein CheX [Anaerolineae bacterium]
MNIRFINPFVVAAGEVLRSEIQTEIQRGELKLQRSSLTGNEVTALLTLVGDVEGVVMYGMSAEMALAFVSRMLGQPVEELNELAQSGIGELGNVITGRASTLLAAEGFSAVISVPTLIVGKNVQISTLDFQRLVVPLLTPYGTLEIHLALRERRNGAQSNQA